jgi:hypothetical protein
MVASLYTRKKQTTYTQSTTCPSAKAKMRAGQGSYAMGRRNRHIVISMRGSQALLVRWNGTDRSVI